MTDSVSKVHIREEQKKLKMSWSVLEDMLTKFAEKNKDKYRSVYGIPRGGSIIAVMLSHKLNIPVVLFEDINSNTLIVDDICDSGKTLRNFLNILKIRSDTYTILYKEKAIPKPTYHELMVDENIWIIFPWEE